MYKLLFIGLIVCSCSQPSDKTLNKTYGVAGKKEILDFLERHQKATGEKSTFIGFAQNQWHKRPYFFVRTKYEAYGARGLYHADINQDGGLEYIYFELDQGSGRYDFLEGIYEENNDHLTKLDFSKDIDNVILVDMKSKGDTIDYVSEGISCCYFGQLRYPIVSNSNKKVRIHWSNGVFEFMDGKLFLEKKDIEYSYKKH
jgi:hypothetical protein